MLNHLGRRLLLGDESMSSSFDCARGKGKGFAVKLLCYSLFCSKRVRGVLVPASRRNGGLVPGMEEFGLQSGLSIPKKKGRKETGRKKENNDLEIMLKCLMICRSVILTFSKKSSVIPGAFPLHGANKYRQYAISPHIHHYCKIK
jgi:hypothetical protein